MTWLQFWFSAFSKGTHRPPRADKEIHNIHIMYCENKKHLCCVLHVSCYSWASHQMPSDLTSISRQLTLSAQLLSISRLFHYLFLLFTGLFPHTPRNTRKIFKFNGYFQTSCNLFLSYLYDLLLVFQTLPLPALAALHLFVYITYFLLKITAY